MRSGPTCPRIRCMRATTRAQCGSEDDIAMHSLRGLPRELPRRDPSRSWRAGGRAVERGDRVHFVRRELPGDDSHLFEDIVLAHALREGHKLPFDVAGLLRLQHGRSEFVAAGTMARRAGRDAALRGTSKYQAFGGIGVPWAAARRG